MATGSVPIEEARQRLLQVSQEYDQLLHLQSAHQDALLQQREAEILHLRTTALHLSSETEEEGGRALAARLRAKEGEMAARRQAKARELALLEAVVQLRDRQIAELERLCEEKHQQLQHFEQGGKPSPCHWQWNCEGLPAQKWQLLQESHATTPHRSQPPVLAEKHEVASVARGPTTQAGSQQGRGAVSDKVGGLCAELAAAGEALARVAQKSAAWESSLSVSSSSHAAVVPETPPAAREREADTLVPEADPITSPVAPGGAPCDLPVPTRNSPAAEEQGSPQQRQWLLLSPAPLDSPGSLPPVTDQPEPTARLPLDSPTALAGPLQRQEGDDAAAAVAAATARLAAARSRALAAAPATAAMGGCPLDDEIDAAGKDEETLVEGDSSYWSNMVLDDEPANIELSQPSPPVPTARSCPQAPTRSGPSSKRAQTGRLLLDHHHHTNSLPQLRPLPEEPSLPGSIFVVSSEAAGSGTTAAPPQRGHSLNTPLSLQGPVLSPDPVPTVADHLMLMSTPGEAAPAPVQAAAPLQVPALPGQSDWSPPQGTSPASPLMQPVSRPSQRLEGLRPRTPATPPGGYYPEPGDTVDEGVAAFLNEPRNRLRRSLLCRVSPGSYLYGTRRMAVRLRDWELEAAEHEGAAWIPFEDFLRRLERTQSGQLQRAWERARDGLPQLQQ